MRRCTCTSRQSRLLKSCGKSFDDSGFTRRISLLGNLISIRLDNSSFMTSYVTQIIETGQKLCGTGFAINNECIGSLLLAGIPEKFSAMIMAIEAFRHLSDNGRH